MKKHIIKIYCLFIVFITLSTFGCFECMGRVEAAEANYLWPVEHSQTIFRGYGWYNKKLHDAQDITGSWPMPIRATKSGVVVKVYGGCSHFSALCWHNDGYGNGVVINHGDGYYSHYAHMETTCVSVGQRVSQGENIGTMGSTGQSTGRHLHFAIAKTAASSGNRINNNPGPINYIYTVQPSDTIPPTISEVKITDHTSEGYTVTCRVTDASGVTKVMFPTWTEANGQDDLMGGNNWENMPGLCGATNGEYATFRVHDTDHSYEKGRYNTHIYAWDQYGNRAGPVTLAVDLTIKNEPVAVTYFQGNKYMLMEDAFGWKDAKSKCEELGGHLVTITSESEQNIVADLLKKGQRISYAMGMTDEKEEGVYKWVTGEKYSFSNWAPNEPSNIGNGEDASVIYNKGGYGGPIAYHGSWNDIPMSTITGYICEIENDKKASATVNWDGHSYALYEDLLTWDEAQKRCKELGGHLVTITSQEEQDAVISLQKKGKKENYYIGLSDTSQEGNFQWVTGETTNFSLWESGQPDNWQRNENYVHLMPDGKWNDVERNQRYGFICEYDGMESSPQIMYQTHTEGFGWLNWVADGAMSGTNGEGRRVEAVKIQTAESNLGVRYRTWVSSRGWTNWSEDGALSGTEGSGLPVEAIDIELTGADKDKYDLYYKTHNGNFGWLDWAKNGQHAGTLGYGYQIEALEIVLIPKKGTPPGRTDVPLKSQNYVEPPVISDIKVTNRSRSGYTVSCKVSSEIKIRKIMFPTWTVNNGQDDLSDSWPSMPEYQGTADQNTITFHVNARDHNNEQGFYSTHIYAWDENGGVSKAFLDPVLLSEVASKGDLNADGKVDIMDARKAKRAAMKEITLTESEFAAADLNGDGKVDIMEARKIKRAAMKEITL